MARSPVLPPSPVPSQHKPIDKHLGHEYWDKYLEQRGDEFASVAELARSMVTLGQVFHRDPTPISILDMGCGNGGLFDLISHQLHRVERYLGVDISSWGVEQAAKRWPLPKVRFETGDLYDYAPKDGQRFDRIIFGDSLQCIDDPIGQVRRYGDFLTDKGWIVACVFEMENRLTEDFWRGSEEHFSVLDVVSVRNDLTGFTWNVRTIRPRGTP